MITSVDGLQVTFKSVEINLLAIIFVCQISKLAKAVRSLMDLIVATFSALPME